MVRDYWDVEQIISEEERIDTTASCEIFHGAHLIEGVGMQQRETGSAEDLLVPAGRKVKIPFWLACQLRHLSPLSFDLPAMFCDSAIDSLQADIVLGSSASNLRKYCAFYFEIGVRVATLFMKTKKARNDMNSRMRWEVLRHRLKMGAQSRWQAILTKLSNSGILESVGIDPLFVQKLTFTEENLFFGIREVEKNIQLEFLTAKEDQTKKRRKIEYN
ncbi:unnamed protein product [Amoebophrya sp. A25]|nr:unnamed protein product [Amoebophrya sp. A25]|eukprot:GSA25T00016237001.1